MPVGVAYLEGNLSAGAPAPVDLSVVDISIENAPTGAGRSDYVVLRRVNWFGVSNQWDWFGGPPPFGGSVVVGDGWGRIDLVENGADIDYTITVLAVVRAAGTLVGSNSVMMDWVELYGEYGHAPGPPGAGWSRNLETRFPVGAGVRTYPWDDSAELQDWTDNLGNPYIVTGGALEPGPAGVGNYNIVQQVAPITDGYLQTDFGAGSWRVDGGRKLVKGHRLTLASRSEWEEFAADPFAGQDVRRPCIAGEDDGALLASATLIESGRTIYFRSRDRGATWSAV